MPCHFAASSCDELWPQSRHPLLTAAQQEEAAKITEQDEEQQPDQLEDVDAGDAAAGAGMDGADDEAGDLQVAPVMQQWTLKRCATRDAVLTECPYRTRASCTFLETAG